MHIKINTLSILRIGLLSLIFIFSSSAFAATTSKYLEEITLPECDASNPEVQFISTNAGWDKINNSSKSIFCVKPGDYRGAGQISLSAKGTSSSRRYIILDDGRETHPGKLQTSEQANVWLSFDNGGSYWTIDRISSLDITSASTLYGFKGGASYNICNRLNIDNFDRAWIVYHLGHNNTLQNSRIANQILSSRKSDRIATGIVSAGVDNCQIHNTKFILNEISNTLDAIQLTEVNVEAANYEGTIIDGNRMWITTDLYMTAKGSDGGVSDVNGLYSYSENALDFKGGSSNSDNPITVTNNIMWGWRKNASDGDPGSSTTVHHTINNFIYEHNIMFDSYTALANISPSNTFSFKHNIIYECDKLPSGITKDALYIYNAHNVEFENNTFVGNNSYSGTNLHNLSKGLTFKNNLYIDNSNVAGSTPDEISGNYYYDTTSESEYSGTNGGAASNANMADLVIDYDIYTNDSKQRILKGVLSTSSSPHKDVAGVINVLVDNTTTSTTVVVTEEPQGPWIIDFNKKEFK